MLQKFYIQNKGIDYDEIFSPMAKMTSINILLVLAVIEDLEVYQIDIKATCLYKDLKEDIHMDQPKGYISEGEEKLVCKVSKTIYGL